LGVCLTFIGNRIDVILAQDDIPVMMIAAVFTLMVFLCATQDIAVDGWALSLLTDDNKTYASTAQTIGLNSGYFLSFTIFLAFNSPEFCNKYIRSVPNDLGLLSLGAYLKFWGIMFLVCNMALILLKTEKPDEEEGETVAESYNTIWRISTMPHMKQFFSVLLIAKIGFIANESVTGLKLMELGFNKEYLALSVLIDFPLQMVFGYYAAKWSSGNRPLFPWTIGYFGRLFSALAGMTVVYNFPASGEISNTYFFIVMSVTILSSFMK
jgi:preprotein translocase subunit Sss1